jgi:transcription elongation factor GreA
MTDPHRRSVLAPAAVTRLAGAVVLGAVLGLVVGVLTDALLGALGGIAAAAPPGMRTSIAGPPRAGSTSTPRTHDDQPGGRHRHGGSCLSGEERVVEPMAEPTASEGTGLSAATRDRLEQELARVREQRHRLAVQLGGEDPDDPDLGDRGDQAVQLEGLDDLARMDRRIGELERLIAGSGAVKSPPGLADGTVVTLRFPDGDVATFRIVAIPEQAPADGQDDVVTAGSPLGQALVGRRAGDTVSYRGPDGDLQAEVIAIHAP